MAAFQRDGDQKPMYGEYGADYGYDDYEGAGGVEYAPSEGSPTGDAAVSAAGHGEAREGVGGQYRRHDPPADAAQHVPVDAAGGAVGAGGSGSRDHGTTLSGLADFDRSAEAHRGVTRPQGSQGGGTQSAAASDDSGYTARLVDKVKSQARELLHLRSNLKSSEGYVALLETRLREVAPGHPLPVTKEHLGAPAGRGSTQGSSGDTAVAGDRTRGLPSHVLSSEAAHRRESVEAAQAYQRLEKQHREVQHKLTESQKQVRELRAQVESSSRDLIAAQKRSRSLATRVAELRSTATGGNRRPARGANKTDGERKAPRSSPAGKGGVRVAELEADIADLQGQLQKSNENLRQEAKAGEERRAYVALLEKALDDKASAAGLGGQGRLLTELARLQGALDAAERDSAAREEANKALTQQVNALNEESDKMRSDLSRTVATAAIRSAGQTAEGATSLLGTAGTISAEDVAHADPTTVATTLTQLETQRAALLDYVQEGKDEIGRLSKELSNAQTHVDELGRRVRSAEQGINERDAKLLASSNQVEQLGVDVSKERAEVARLQALLEDALQQGDAVRQESDNKVREIAELAAIQEELVSSVRQHKQASDVAHADVASLRASVAELEAKLGAAEREAKDADTARAGEALRRREQSSDSDRQIQQLEAGLGEASEEISALRTERDAHLAELEKTTRDLEAANDTAATATAEARETQGKLETVEAELQDLAARFGNLKEEADSLQAAQRAVADLEREVGSVPVLSSAEVTEDDSDSSRPDGNDPACSRGHLYVRRSDAEMEWAGGAALASALPETSLRVRRLCEWLREAGAELSSAGARVDAEQRDKVTQRRLLHDEIHSLRTDGAEQTDELVETRTQLAQFERELAESRQQHSAEVEALNNQLAAATETGEAAADRAATVTAELAQLSKEHASATDRLAAVEAACTAASEANERSGAELAAARSELADVCSVRDSLAEQNSTTRADLEEARREATSLNLEKRVLLEKVASMEESESANEQTATRTSAQLAAALERVDSLDAELGPLRSRVAELEKQVDDQTGMHGESSAAAAEREAALQRDLEAAAGLAEQQNELAAELEATNAVLAEEKGAMQRTVVALTVDIERARSALLSALNSGEVRVQSAEAGFELPLSPSKVKSGSGSPLGPSGGDSSSDGTSRGLSDQLLTCVERGASALRALAARSAVADEARANAERSAQEAHDALRGARPQMEALAAAEEGARSRAETLVAARSEVSELRSQLASAESRLQVATEEAGALRAQVLELQTDYEQGASRVATLAAEAEAARSSERRAKAELSTAVEQAKSLEQELQLLNDSAAAATALRHRAESEVARDGSKLHAVQRELAALTAGRDRLEGVVAQQREQSATQKAEITSAKAEVARLTAEVREVQRSAASKDAEIQELRSRLVSRDDDQAALERDVAADLRALSDENSTAARARDNALSALAVQQAEAAHLRAEAIQFKERCQQLQTLLEEKQRLVHQLAAERDALVARVSTADATVASLRVAANTAIGDADAERGQLASALGEKDRLERELLGALQENEALRSMAPVAPAPAPAHASLPTDARTVLARHSDPSNPVTDMPTLRISRSGSIRVHVPDAHLHRDGQAADAATSTASDAGRGQVPSTPISEPQQVTHPRGSAVRSRVASYGISVAPSGGAPTPGAARLQEQLRRAQATFAGLRDSTRR